MSRKPASPFVRADAPFRAALLTALPEALRFMREYRMVFYGVIMIVMMITRPPGILDRGLFAPRGRKESA